MKCSLYNKIMKILYFSSFMYEQLLRERARDRRTEGKTDGQTDRQADRQREMKVEINANVIKKHKARLF